MEHSSQLVDRTYRLHQLLGAGGMGAVFRATHVINAQELALKFVTSTGVDDTDIQSVRTAQRLRLALAREFETLASLQHPNLVEVVSYGFDEERGPYLAMELLPDPQTILEAAMGQPFAVKIGLIAQLLRALSYINQRGILHRDLKPSSSAIVEEQVLKS